MATITSGLTKEQLEAKSPAELLAIIESLTAKKANVEGEKTVKIGSRTFTLRVSPKGGVSVYGFGRFPVTLYREQWEFMFALVADVKEFLTANADKLSSKSEE